MATLLILAAGLGSRYGGLKQMDGLGPSGETVLDYSVFDAWRAGFTRVVFVVRETFVEAFAARSRALYGQHIEFAFACQDLADLPAGFAVPEGRSRPWGTTHAVLAARRLLDEPFAVINADDFYGRDAFVRLAAFLRRPAGEGIERCAMVGYPLGATLSPHGGVNRGICRAQDGRLIAVEEFRDLRIEADGLCRGDNFSGRRIELSYEAIVSMNAWALTPAVVEGMGAYFADFLSRCGQSREAECYIPEVVDALIRQKRAEVHILDTAAQWFGVTYPSDRAPCQENLRALIAAGEYTPQLWAAARSS